MFLSTTMTTLPPAILEQPFLGLGEDFPHTLYLLHHATSGKFGCYCHDGTHGLACFSTENGAFRFAELIDMDGMTSLETTFDEAREIAKSRPMPIVSLILLDRLQEPVVHFVR